MDEKISQDILDKILLIKNRMKSDIERYEKVKVNSDLFSLAAIAESLIQLSNVVLRLISVYNIPNMYYIDENQSYENSIRDAYVFCEKIENLFFLNSLQDDNFSITFDAKWKDRIRTYVVAIKSILDGTNIENERLKNSIFSKLNAFEKELDQTKTSLQKFEMAFVDVTYAIGAGCKNLEPAYRLFYKVMKSFGKLTDIANHPQLPHPDDYKLLPPPDKNEDEQ